MRWDRGLCIVLSGTLVAGAAFAQSSNKPSTADQRRIIRVGIAAMTNRSRHPGSPTWERNQLMRELQRLRADRKSSIILEAVSLEASSREDASAEAERKGCQYFVLTTLLDPSHGPGISGGPDGAQPAPVIIGNTNANQTLAMDFTILEVGTARTLTEGTAAAPVEDNNDIRAADEAMRLVAHRVASELRKDRPPSPD
ncbi:MAG: hypothetical protein WAN76_13200 [Candidatus Sulfotelmatobacter sp.]